MFNIPDSYSMAMTHEIVVRLPDLPVSWLVAVGMAGLLYIVGRFLGRAPR